ncbi:TIGR03067 domain-containing protein [Singulisphaera acidiphila]|uniref:Uncharacterized protein n=1 Tax=Singulisphaera acidiphila (strain ATCC BAA-1392 / DSM 18658 / VKM B-2454 / MOB10) TaxID=886293 RepID=L0DKA5_SINAD|nr:TIGR03067 domain-containing protein [Singulisphaera acidiphila]AGA29086.1 hypothetical protein Sinac_4930 [Singulisphaera acidiphila DSM 18658]
MSPRANLALVIALWVVPLAIGIAIASRFIARDPIEDRPADREPEEGRILDEGPRTSSDRELLQGAWECARLERNGRVVYRGEQARTARVTFESETVTFEDVGATLQGQFRLDPSRRPRTFDLIIAEGDDVVTYPVGIYELTDDTFRLCFAFPSQVRPTSFETFPGSGRTLFIYRRIPFGGRGGRKFARTSVDQGCALGLNGIGG